MNQFSDREKAFEAKFHVDEELAFKVNARRDKLLGLWVAGHIGIKGVEAEVYARKLVEVDLVDSHHEALMNKLLTDLAAAKAPIGEAELKLEMMKLAAIAEEQIMGEMASGHLTVSPT